MQGAVWECILNDAATIAATASADFTACVWNSITGDELHRFGHGHIVRTLQLAHTKQQLLTAGACPAPGCCCPPGSTCTLPECKLQRAGRESKLRIFDLERPEAAPTVLEGFLDQPRSICLHPDDKLLLMAHLDKPGIRCCLSLLQTSLAVHPLHACAAEQAKSGTVRGLRRQHESNRQHASVSGL